MEGSRLLRFLRIAVTALSLTACVLLIALWVRSYTLNEQFIVQVSSQRCVAIASSGGAIILYTNAGSHYPTWTWISEPTPHIEYPPWISLKWKPNVVTLYLPNWILLVLTTTIAVTPWIHWSKRFSLRTLLIAMTLVAVTLAAIVYASR